MRHPDDYWVNHSLAMALVDARDYPGGIRYAQAAVGLRPQSPSAHYFLGVCGYAG